LLVGTLQRAGHPDSADILRLARGRRWWWCSLGWCILWCWHPGV